MYASMYNEGTLERIIEDTFRVHALTHLGHAFQTYGTSNLVIFRDRNILEI